MLIYEKGMALLNLNRRIRGYTRTRALLSKEARENAGFRITTIANGKIDCLYKTMGVCGEKRAQSLLGTLMIQLYRRLFAWRCVLCHDFDDPLEAFGQSLALERGTGDDGPFAVGDVGEVEQVDDRAKSEEVLRRPRGLRPGPVYWRRLAAELRLIGDSGVNKNKPSAGLPARCRTR